MVRKTVVRSFWALTALLLAGCVVIGDRADQLRWRFLTLPYFVFDNAPGYICPKQKPVLDEDVNLAVAISGGGVRASVFAAAVLEQLACIPDPRRPGHSVLERCQVISGVSGGSLAAAYYSLFKPARLDDAKANAAFFQQYKINMGLDVGMRGAQHYISHPWDAALKYYTRYRISQSLANLYDRYIFQGATFCSLNQREASGEAPAVIINAASLDTGAKFLFTNLALKSNFTVDPAVLLPKLPSMVSSADLPGMQTIAKLCSAPIFRSSGFESIDSDILGFRVSCAVAASSAQPIMPGPSTLIDYATKGYVHLADGGINDNFGIDALVEMYLAKLQKSRKANKLVIIAINSTANSGGKDRSGDPNGYNGALAYGNKAFYSLSQRSLTFSTAVYDQLDAIGLVMVNLGDSDKIKCMTNQLTLTCISETDFNIVVAAAADAAQAHREQIVSELSHK